VLIHVGFAMAKIDEEEARRALEDLQLMGQSTPTKFKRSPNRGLRSATQRGMCGASHRNRVAPRLRGVACR